MERGVVKWFNEKKGFGFITRDEGGPDAFVHYTDLEGDEGYKTINEGDRVEFEVIQERKGAKARAVRKI